MTMSTGRPYGEWAVGLGVKITLSDGQTKSWSEEQRAVGLEDTARQIAESRLRARSRLDYPQANRIEVRALSSRLVIDHFPKTRHGPSESGL